MQLLSSSRLPKSLARAPQSALRSSAAPSFARAGGYEVLTDPFRARLHVVHGEPGDAELSTRLTLLPRSTPVLVHWEVARDARFDDIERYGLFFAQAQLDYQLRVALTGLSPGRGYWARLWAGGSWSPTVRLHTETHLRARARMRASTARLALAREPHLAFERLLRPMLRSVPGLAGPTPRSSVVPPESATGPADL